MRSESGRPATGLVLGCLFTCEALLLWAAALPISGRFELFLQRDYGANLTAQALLRQGVRPCVDFFYPYGLWSLLIGRAWYAIAGLTPWAYLIAVAICHVGIAWGLARFVMGAKAGVPGLMMAVLGLPIAVPPTFANLCHGLEMLCLVWALSAIIRGRIREALIWAVLATLAKPSMGYLFGALLVVSEVYRQRDDVRRCLRTFAPAAGVGLGAVFLLGLCFDVSTIFTSFDTAYMSPLYRLWGFGFFHGTGRLFWLPDGAKPADYLGTIRGYWLAATFVLTIASLFLLVRWGGERNPRALSMSGPEHTVLLCVVAHWAFVCLFFGSTHSWTYYVFLLVMGGIGLAAWGGRATCWALVLALLAGAADRGLPRQALAYWRETGLVPRAAGLWTTPEALNDWRDVLTRIEGRGAFFLAESGCAPTLFPQFEPASHCFLVKGFGNSPDERRCARRIEWSEVVVVPRPGSVPPGSYEFLLFECPDIRAALRSFEIESKNERFEVWARVRQPTGEGPGPK